MCIYIYIYACLYVGIWDYLKMTRHARLVNILTGLQWPWWIYGVVEHQPWISCCLSFVGVYFLVNCRDVTPPMFNSCKNHSSKTNLSCTCTFQGTNISHEAGIGKSFSKTTNRRSWPLVPCTGMLYHVLWCDLQLQKDFNLPFFHDWSANASTFCDKLPNVPGRMWAFPHSLSTSQKNNISI